MNQKVCIRCGSSKLESGSLGSFGLTFRPANTKFLTMKTNDVRVESNMCIDCGTIELVGDVRKAAPLVGDKAKPH